MGKSYYFCKLANTELAGLIKVKLGTKIHIQDNTTTINFDMFINKDNYQLSGIYEYGYGSQYYNASDEFKIYKNGSNEYFLCIVGNPTHKYLNVDVVNKANDGGSIMDYDASFDTTGLTELLPVKKTDIVTNRKMDYSPTIAANTVTEYVSKTRFRENMTQCSLVLFSIRNNNAVGVNALLFLHRKCGATADGAPDFSIETIYSETGLSNFSLTGTADGFTFTSNANYRYSITEISNVTDMQVL